MKKIFVLVSLIGLVFVLGCFERFFNPVEVYSQPQEKFQGASAEGVISQEGTVKEIIDYLVFAGSEQSIGHVKNIEGRNVTLLTEEFVIVKIPFLPSTRIVAVDIASPSSIGNERPITFSQIKVGDNLNVLVQEGTKEAVLVFDYGPDAPSQKQK